MPEQPRSVPHRILASERLRTGRVVPVLRAPDGAAYQPVVEVLAEAGITSVELTLTTPGTLRVLPVAGVAVQRGSGDRGRYGTHRSERGDSGASAVKVFPAGRMGPATSRHSAGPSPGSPAAVRRDRCRGRTGLAAGGRPRGELAGDALAGGDVRALAERARRVRVLIHDLGGVDASRLVRPRSSPSAKPWPCSASRSPVCFA